MIAASSLPPRTQPSPARFTAALFLQALCLVIREKRNNSPPRRGAELKPYLFYLRCYHKKFIVTFYGFDIASTQVRSARPSRAENSASTNEFM